MTARLSLLILPLPGMIDEHHIATEEVLIEMVMVVVVVVMVIVVVVIIVMVVVVIVVVVMVMMVTPLWNSNRKPRPHFCSSKIEGSCLLKKSQWREVQKKSIEN